MPMTQEDIRSHYEEAWKKTSDAAKDDAGLVYSSPIEDAVLYPLYERMIGDLKIAVNGGRVLDVGSGSGRWIRFFRERYQPALLMGVDFTRASVELLKQWCTSREGMATRFQVADMTQPELDLGEKFDLINIANVLFHIPEADRFARALQNLRAHLAPGGRVVTTEYLPRATMRTEWMMVLSRYDFQKAVEAAGMRIIDVKASVFFSNDPMGLDGPDAGTRMLFNRVRQGVSNIFDSKLDPNTKQFFVQFLAEVERACLSFCRERVAEIDMPSQKLVVLGAA